LRVPPLPRAKARKAKKARKAPERVVVGGAMFGETDQLLDVRPQSRSKGGGAAGDVAVVLRRTIRAGKVTGKKIVVEPIPG
jgi:hypothetical protein